MKTKLIIVAVISVNLYYIITKDDIVSRLTRGRVLLNYKCVEDK